MAEHAPEATPIFPASPRERQATNDRPGIRTAASRAPIIPPAQPTECAFYVGLGSFVARRHEPDLVTELDQLASPMVSCGASFDADQAGRQLCEERKELRPSDLSADDHGRSRRRRAPGTLTSRCPTRW